MKNYSDNKTKPFSKKRFQEDSQNYGGSDQMKTVAFRTQKKTSQYGPNRITDSYGNVANQIEVFQLKKALCQAIEENQILRERVIELEALLAQAQQRIENFQEHYIMDMNNLRKMIFQGKTASSSSVQRSRSL